MPPVGERDPGYTECGSRPATSTAWERCSCSWAASVPCRVPFRKKLGSWDGEAPREELATLQSLLVQGGNPETKGNLRMPDPGNSAGRFAVHCSSAITATIRSVDRQARRQGQGKAVTRAFRQV